MKTRTRFARTLVLFLAVLALGLAPLSAQAVAFCTSPTFVGTTSSGSTLWECVPATATAVPSATTSASATVTALPSNTPAPTSTSTSTPSQTATATSSPTSAAPTVTASPTQPALAAVDPAILGTCPAGVHDRFVVTGPDGKLYRTWHPQIVFLDPADPSAGTCTFAHEHGDDPQLSIANPHMPAFGYIGAQVNDAEPHAGFKVFVVNQGALNNDGYTAANSTRIVFHMGTGGAKRFDTEFHSLMFDLVAPDGHYVHVQGMGDTGGVGNICASPRQGKTVMELPSSGCVLQSGYEIWGIVLNVGNKATINAAVGVFDPITVLDQNSLPGQRPTLLTANVYPQFGTTNRGCRRESYSGPVYWYNRSGPTTFTTDAYGAVGTALTQSVSAHSDIGIRMADGNFFQMKLKADACLPGLGLGN